MGAGKRIGRAAAYPILRLLEPRFADVVRRVTDTRQAVHDEAAATRAAIEPLLASYAASSGESLTFVGTQLRELIDELHTTQRPQLALFPDAAELARLKDAGSLIVLVLKAADADHALTGWTVEDRAEADGLVLVSARG